MRIVYLYLFYIFIDTNSQHAYFPSKNYDMIVRVDFVPSSGALRAVVRLPSSLDPPVITRVAASSYAVQPKFRR